MSITNLKKVFFFLLLISITQMGYTTAKIVVIRNENWDHPVEKIFKKHDISLYKVQYSKDGTCPTFYAKFKENSEEVKSPASSPIYAEILKANFQYPYALVDEKKNLKINVGWEDKAKKNMVINIDKASSLSTCLGNDHANIDDGEDYDPFIINKEMKDKILQSPYKSTLYNKKGKAFIAYLYSENAIKTPTTSYDCISPKGTKSVESRGNYYIYLYDVSSDSFFPGRIEPFKKSFEVTMNIPGADFFTLPTTPNVLMLSQRGACDGDDYEVYGFSEQQLFLKPYHFFTNKKQEIFYGRINKLKENGQIIAYGDNPQTKKLYLSVSEAETEVKLKPVNGVPD